MNKSDIEIYSGLYEGNEVRTLILNNEIWFVAKDVCAYFGDTNYRRSIKNVDPEDKGVSQVMTNGGLQKMTIINEAGLYDLCFQMRPNMARGVTNDYIAHRQEILKKFIRWITHEVLPSIRKNGYYINPSVFSNSDSIDALIDYYLYKLKSKGVSQS